MTEPVPHTPAQEPEGVHGRFVAWLIVAAVAVTLLCIFTVRMLLQAERRDAARSRDTPHYPVGETVGGIEQRPIAGRARGEMAAREAREALGKYGWVNREHTIAKIPIDRAMQWLVEDSKRGALPNPDPATTLDSGSSAEKR
ncbi:MAG TPA: hypothetical protein VHU80_04970 [Polyangiaceae bacterium]|jgi:hypothetical protein|nr:hypothetical protein [Polyangiaceae bacterium]